MKNKHLLKPACITGNAVGESMLIRGKYKIDLAQLLHKKILIALLVTLLFGYSYGQEHPEEMQHDHEHEHHTEISLSANTVFIPTEEAIAPGFHAQFVRGIALENKLGIGMGLEAILHDHQHYTLGIIGQYNLIKGLFVVYAPGLLMLVEDTEKEFMLAQHFEINYEWGIGNIHLGPSAGLGIAREGMHYSLGLHIGIHI